MNYSTIKKVVAYSMLSVLGFTAANAQTTSSSAKVFGGTSQYRTWSVGINAGILDPTLVIGGTNDFNSKDLGLGYGLTLRDQIGHSFGVELSALRGTLKGHNEFSGTAAQKDAAFNAAGASRFRTDFGYAVDLKGVFNFATIDFLHRENSLNFIAKAGFGATGYKAWLSSSRTNGVAISDAALKKEEDAAKPKFGPNGDHTYIHNVYIPVGLGIAYKLSDKISLDLGYNMYFLDDDNLDAYRAKYTSKDKWSYGYAGVDFSIGDMTKPNLDWANPVALMYDELKDPTLRQELEALKGRVSTLENTVSQLSADADGDGVSNKFDKCAGTPAGVQVDGSGCPIKFPAPPAPVEMKPAGGMHPSYDNIQFEFDSSVLKTSSYPVLDLLSADLRNTPGASITLNGYASAEGTDTYNLRLSTDRANSVKSYLVNSGVDASRITATGFGEASPVASNATEEGRVQNRRVEIKK